MTQFKGVQTRRPVLSGHWRTLHRAARWLGLTLTLTLGAASTPSLAAAPAAPIINPTPTARDWADLAKLPDWGGIWIPETYLITTAKYPPPWRPEIIKDVNALKALDAAGHPKGLYTNCLPEGMPSFMIMTVASSEFLFTPGRVTILNEFDGNRTRRIYTDGRGHPDDPDLTFNGHSIGHWDGDTLVVDTIGILPETYLPINQAVGIPNDGDTHVVERIHLVGPDHLVDELTIDAPRVLAAPWRIIRNFTRNRERGSISRKAPASRATTLRARTPRATPPLFLSAMTRTAPPWPPLRRSQGLSAGGRPSASGVLQNKAVVVDLAARMDVN